MNLFFVFTTGISTGRSSKLAAMSIPTTVAADRPAVMTLLMWYPVGTDRYPCQTRILLYCCTTVLPAPLCSPKEQTCPLSHAHRSIDFRGLQFPYFCLQCIPPYTYPLANILRPCPFAHGIQEFTLPLSFHSRRHEEDTTNRMHANNVSVSCLFLVSCPCFPSPICPFM